ncbi:hypothetical protein ACSQ67_022820 [Phaseolus vulgaris]
MDHASSSSFLIIYFILFVILYSLLFIHFSSFIQRRSSLSRVANGSSCEGNCPHTTVCSVLPAVFLGRPSAFAFPSNFAFSTKGKRKYE